MALVLTLSVVVPVYGARPFTMPPASGHHRLTRPLTQGMILTVSGTGTAFNITDQSKTLPASISLTVKVDRASLGGAKLTVMKDGTLMIGSETFTVAGGHGILNFHSHKMVLHVSLKDSNGRHLHLILFGINAPSSFEAGSHPTISFVNPQSKLAGRWFLTFPGAAVTRK